MFCSDIIEDVAGYVYSFLRKHLSADLHFHNLQHTYRVVEAAKEIGKNCNFSEEEMNILITAAWFHDCGYAITYLGHEQESKKIAGEFLEARSCEPDFVSLVLNCIEATRYPQKPLTKIEEAICDADLYHLTKPDYPTHEKALRLEFEICLGRQYSDDEWLKENCRMFASHSYFTSYGKNVLEKFKAVNFNLLNCLPGHEEK
ncbi:MAG: HD domain-containing protein [Ferruginibacter sp.]